MKNLFPSTLIHSNKNTRNELRDKTFSQRSDCCGYLKACGPIPWRDISSSYDRCRAGLPFTQQHKQTSNNHVKIVYSLNIYLQQGQLLQKMEQIDARQHFSWNQQPSYTWRWQIHDILVPENERGLSSCTHNSQHFPIDRRSSHSSLQMQSLSYT